MTGDRGDDSEGFSFDPCPYGPRCGMGKMSVEGRKDEIPRHLAYDFSGPGMAGPSRISAVTVYSNYQRPIKWYNITLMLGESEVATVQRRFHQITPGDNFVCEATCSTLCT